MKKSDLYLIIGNMWIVCEWLSTNNVFLAFAIAACFITLSIWYRLRNE
jgi:hypothetical protein